MWLDLIENVFTACAGDADNDQNIDQLRVTSNSETIMIASSIITPLASELKLTCCLGHDWTGNLFQTISLSFYFDLR